MTASNDYTWTDEAGRTKAELWPDGPWMVEPDKVVWRDETTGLDCMIVRGGLGALCGYVGVTPDHPYYGHDYPDVPVEAHGGLTYADACHGVICHVPDDPSSDDVWWFGFDCAHYQDLVPHMIRYRTPGTERLGEAYRDIAYVTREVTNLALQLHQLTSTTTESKES